MNESLTIAQALVKEGVFSRIIGGVLILAGAGVNFLGDMVEISDRIDPLIILCVGVGLVLVPPDIITRLIPRTRRAADQDGFDGPWKALIRDDIAVIGCVVDYYRQFGQPVPRQFVADTFADVEITNAHRAVPGCLLRMLTYDPMERTYAPTPEFLEWCEAEKPAFDDGTRVHDAIAAVADYD